jgi:hypothetical protein
MDEVAESTEVKAIVNTRSALRGWLFRKIEKELEDRWHEIEGGELDGIKVLSKGNLEEVLYRLKYEQLPPAEKTSGEVRTPSVVTVWAVCPHCGIAQDIGLTIDVALILDPTGTHLKLLPKSKARTHVCNQLLLPQGEEDVQLTISDIVGERCPFPGCVLQVEHEGDHDIPDALPDDEDEEEPEDDADE